MNKQKLKDSFKVTLPEYFKIPSYYVQGVTLPEFDPYYNDWFNLKIKFIDAFEPSISDLLLDLVSKNIKDFKNENIVIIESLNNGEIIGQWKIDFDSIQKIQMGKFNYQSEKFLSPSITLNPTAFIYKSF